MRAFSAQSLSPCPRRASGSFRRASGSGPPGPGVARCEGEGPFPWQERDVPAIPGTAGDSINVVIEADERPQKLRVAIFGDASKHASDAAMRVVELDPGLEAPLAVDLPASVYNLRITGQWEVGEQSYKFRLKVE